MGMYHALHALMAVICASLLSGCAGLFLSPAERADAQARAGKFQPVSSVTGPIKAWLRVAPDAVADAPLTVYIEGDGAHWRGPYRPPADPTPDNALTLRLALRDPGARVAYVGRPCQYLNEEALAQCAPSLWIRARYGDTALSIVNAAIDDLKQATGAPRLQLVGFSGGGAIAMLIAARRADVACFVTLASPLDTAAWISALDLSPLTGSHNPLDYASRLRFAAQTHFAAADDEIVPPATLSEIKAALPYTHFEVMPAYDHDCCWVRAWEMLRARSCLNVQ